MPINARRILTLPMFILKLGFNCCRMVKQRLAFLIKEARRYLKTFIHRPINLLPSTALRPPSGVPLVLNNHRRVPLRRRWEALSGTVPWLKSAILAFLLSS